MPVKTIAMKRLEGQKRTFYMDEHGGYQHEYVDFYPAELVEKIITDLSNQVLEWRRNWNSLFFRSKLRRRELLDNRHAAVTEKDKELRHANYKRCLTMSWYCESLMREAFLGNPEYIEWLDKWRERWLKIADKFKAAK